MGPLLCPRLPYGALTYPIGATMTEKTALTVRDVAGLLNVDSKTVYRLVQKGELPGFKVAGSWRFMDNDIESWIEAQKTGPRDQRRDHA